MVNPYTKEEVELLCILPYTCNSVNVCVVNGQQSKTRESAWSMVKCRKSWSKFWPAVAAVTIESMGVTPPVIWLITVLMAVNTYAYMYLFIKVDLIHVRKFFPCLLLLHFHTSLFPSGAFLWLAGKFSVGTAPGAGASASAPIKAHNRFVSRKTNYLRRLFFISSNTPRFPDATDYL